MAVSCGPVFGVCRVRLTRVDAQGNVIAGNNAYVTDNQISVAVNPNIDTGNTVTIRNGCGCGLSRKKLPDVFNWFEFAFVNGTLEPEMEAFLLGADTIVDGGDTVGVAYPGALACDEDPPAVAFEFWVQKMVGSGADPQFPWVHYVYPMTLWTLGNTQFQEDYARPEFSGHSQTNSNWGDGPYGDGPPDGQVNEEGDWWFTDVEPPTPECAAQAVTDVS